MNAIPSNTDNPIWLVRLAAGIKESGLSKRDISIAAGLGPNYIQQLFKDGKEPSVSCLAAIAKALEISMVSLFSEEKS